MALDTLETMVGNDGLLQLAAPGTNDPKTYYVKGYYVAGDGGGGVYIWDSASQEQPNAGSVVAKWNASGEPPAYPTSGRWLLKHDGVVNVRQFGAKGTNSSETLTAQGTSRWASDDHIKATYPPKVGGPFRNNVPGDTVDWAAIQAALVWAGPKGVRVEVQSGIYVCSAPVWLADDSLLPTLGKDATSTGLTFLGMIGNSRRETDDESANLRLSKESSNRYALTLSGGMNNIQLLIERDGTQVTVTGLTVATTWSSFVTTVQNALNTGTSGWTVEVDGSDQSSTAIGGKTTFFRIKRPGDTDKSFLGDVTATASDFTEDGFIACYADSGLISFRRGAGLYYRVGDLTLKGNETGTSRKANFAVLMCSTQFIGHVIERVHVAYFESCFGILKGTGNNGEQVRFDRLYGSDCKKGFFCDAPQAFLQEFRGWYLGLDNDGVYLDLAEADPPGYGVGLLDCHATFGPGGNDDGKGTLVRIRRGTGIVQWTGGRIEHMACLFDYDALDGQGPNESMDLVLRGVEFDATFNQAAENPSLPFVNGTGASGTATQYGLVVDACRFASSQAGGVTAAQTDLLLKATAPGLRCSFVRTRFDGFRSIRTEGLDAEFDRCFRSDFSTPGATSNRLREFTEVTGTPGPRTQSLRTAWQDTPWIQTGPRVNVLKNSTLNLQSTGTGQTWSAPSWTLERISGTGLPPTLTFGRWGTAGVSNVGDLNPGPESFGLVLPANRRLRNTVSYVDLGFDSNPKVVTYQCLCRVTGRLTFKLVNDADPTVVYDEVVLDPGGSSPTDPTLVTLRMQVSGTGSGSPQLRIENTATEGGATATWQVYWQQAWSGGGRSGSTVAQGLPNYGFGFDPVNNLEAVGNTYPWSVTAIGIKAFSRFQLPLKSEQYGWRANAVTGEDLNNGEVYYDEEQRALLARMELEWVCLVQPERWFTEPTQTTFVWNRGTEKNIVMSASGTKTFTLNTGSNGAVAKGTVARVFNASTSGEIRVNGSTINTVQPGNAAEFVFDGTSWRATQLDVKGRVV